jgi:hypothetical protein
VPTSGASRFWADLLDLTRIPNNSHNNSLTNPYTNSLKNPLDRTMPIHSGAAHLHLQQTAISNRFRSAIPREYLPLRDRLQDRHPGGHPSRTDTLSEREIGTHGQ